jgi:hypothetical protein
MGIEALHYWNDIRMHISLSEKLIVVNFNSKALRIYTAIDAVLFDAM